MRNKQDITDSKKLWIALLRSSQLFTMTFFVSSTLRCFSGLLHCVRNDGQRWLASIYDDAFRYVLIKRHFACSSGTKRTFAMRGNRMLCNRRNIRRLSVIARSCEERSKAIQSFL
jgi:hypothetical protein